MSKQHHRRQTGPCGGQGRLEAKSPRNEWRSRYRAARAMYRLYNSYRARLAAVDMMPRFFLDAANACPGYCPTRLSPDLLEFCVSLGILNLHEVRMTHLRRRSRLPA